MSQGHCLTNKKNIYSQLNLSVKDKHNLKFTNIYTPSSHIYKKKTFFRLIQYLMYLVNI